MDRVHALALCHIASQLIYRWLPPPPLSRTDSVQPQGVPLNARLRALAQLSPADWRELALSESVTIPPRLPWLAAYLQKDPDARQLAAAATHHFTRLHGAGGHYLVLGDSQYPAALLALADPPLALSLIGALDLLDRPRLSVVGSRKASAYAMHESFALGRALAEAGTVVVSGGAFGCDIAAHHGVLATALQPAPALCVFASGLQTLYPRGNHPIFQRLTARSGLLCSERLWAAACRPLDFRGRNRIIAGLSPITVVMQAGARSGALVTAHLALDQGREVAVMRHADGDVRAQGSCGLVQDGAWAFNDAAGLMQGLALAASALPVPAQTVAITLTSC